MGDKTMGREESGESGKEERQNHGGAKSCGDRTMRGRMMEDKIMGDKMMEAGLWVARESELLELSTML